MTLGSRDKGVFSSFFSSLSPLSSLPRSFSHAPPKCTNTNRTGRAVRGKEAGDSGGHGQRRRRRHRTGGGRRLPGPRGVGGLPLQGLGRRERRDSGRRSPAADTVGPDHGELEREEGEKEKREKREEREERERASASEVFFPSSSFFYSATPPLASIVASSVAPLLRHLEFLFHLLAER